MKGILRCWYREAWKSWHTLAIYMCAKAMVAKATYLQGDRRVPFRNQRDIYLGFVSTSAGRVAKFWGESESR